MLETLGYQRHKKLSRIFSKLEPIKHIKPTKKRITIPQSACIINILDDLIRQFEIIDYIHLITANTAIVAKQVSLDLTDKDPSPTDVHMPGLQQTLAHMCHNHQSLLTNETKLDRPTLTMLVQNSTKDMLRVLMKRSKLFERLKLELAEQKKAEGGSHVAELTSLLQELRACVYDRLVLTRAEEKEMFLQSMKALEKDERYQERIGALRQQKAELVEHYERKIKVQNDVIRNLELECKEVERAGTERIADLKKKADLLGNIQCNDSKARLERYSRELEELKKQLRSHEEEHRHQELQLRKERWKCDGHNEALLRKYDNTFTIKQNKYDEIKRAYAEETAVLAELEEKFKPLEAEYNKVRRLVDLLFVGKLSNSGFVE